MFLSQIYKNVSNFSLQYSLFILKNIQILIELLLAYTFINSW